MASAANVVATVGTEIGLSAPVGSGTCYGMWQGYLVQLSPTKDSNNAARVTVRIDYRDATRDDAVRQALAADAGLAAAGVKPKHVQVGDGAVVHAHSPSGVTGSFSPERLRQALEALLSAVKAATPAPPGGCRVCGVETPADPVLVDGTVDRLCRQCVDSLHAAAQDAQAAYDAAKTRTGLALAAALAAGLAGAALWAGVGIGTGRMFWMLAIAIGAGVGIATSKAAGKGGLFVQCVSVVVTVAAVLAGNILMYAYYVHREAAQQGATVDWAAFVSVIPRIMGETGSDTLFALGGGLIGAFYAARATGRKKFAVKVE